jgi:myo-inositol 2-dehydrogenase/D-chiro-inositol 1-dehydrogenase
VSDKPFRLGLIGAGRMGRMHLRALAESTRVSVTAIVEPAAAIRASFAGTGVQVYETVTELLEARGVDGALIAAPSDRHAEIVSLVASSGLPILCEKPCGLSSRENRVAAQAVVRHGVPFQVAYWRRYVPALCRLRDRIRAGELGDIHLYVSSQWDGQPPQAAFRAHSGGIFLDMGVHEFDQVRWLSGEEFGEIAAVSSPSGAAPGAESDVDSAQALATMSSGASAFVSLGRYYPGGDMARIEVFGTRDAVRCEFLDPKDGERIQLSALLAQAEAFASFAAGGPATGATAADAAAALLAAERAWSAIQPLRPAVHVAGADGQSGSV